MPDKLKCDIAPDSLIDDIVCARCVNGMDITMNIIIEKIIDADADFSQMIPKNPPAQIQIA